MTTLNRIELQTGFPCPPHSRVSYGLTAHEHVGFELGWDYAHYRVTPPAPYAQEPSPLHNGLLAGQAAFGARTLAATRHVRKWLQLRLHAWLRGRSVELVQVTPNYLQQIDVSHCPITRAALSRALLSPSDASVDRVRNDAGYAAGNLAVMSTRANHAKAACSYRDALRVIEPTDARPAGAAVSAIDALLAADEWARIAVLCSFVEPLPHAEACAVPLRLLPPNRLRLFNPVQALQAFVSQQLLKPGWARRVGGFEELLAGKTLKRDFKSFFMALLPRVLEGVAKGVAESVNVGVGAGGRLGGTEPTPQTRWAIEDAWRSPLVLQRWTRFALQLTPAQCEALLVRAAAHRIGTGAVMPHTDASATDGWNLDTRGYVAHTAPGAEGRGVLAQRQFAW